MQNLDLSLIIDRSWYLFLSMPCQRGFVQEKIYLGMSFPDHTLADRGGMRVKIFFSLDFNDF